MDELEDPVKLFKTTYVIEGVRESLELLTRYPALGERRGQEYLFRIEEITKRQITSTAA